MGWYAGPEPPDGYLYCDGSAIGREAYSELYEAIGTLYGAGDGAETFNLPDARGIFFRGDGGENNAAMGVRQGDAIRDITGSFNIRNREQSSQPQGYDHSIWKSSGVLALSQDSENEAAAFMPANDIGTFPSTLVTFSARYSVPTATENRPVNLAMKPCIRYV